MSNQLFQRKPLWNHSFLLTFIKLMALFFYKKKKKSALFVTILSPSQKNLHFYFYKPNILCLCLMIPQILTGVFMGSLHYWLISFTLNTIINFTYCIVYFNGCTGYYTKDKANTKLLPFCFTLRSGICLSFIIVLLLYYLYYYSL